MSAVEVELETLAEWIAILRVSAELHRANDSRYVQAHGDAVDRLADDLERLYTEALRRGP